MSRRRGSDGRKLHLADNDTISPVLTSAPTVGAKLEQGIVAVGDEGQAQTEDEA